GAGLKLRISRQDIAHLRSEAERVRPVEACALLFGRLSGSDCGVTKVVDTENRLQSTERFEVDPEVAVAALSKAEEEGLDLVGLFHSHSAPAVPSTVDLQFMRLWGDAVWLILSLTDGDFSAYQLLDRKLREVHIDIE
ncbi:MAG: M67 family metallopeptidase, partial [Candidatus Bathyarchaeota archaeon]|nr:M67 family metallopeptidase [Candidatus Bathyarchaeota archaeon]